MITHSDYELEVVRHRQADAEREVAGLRLEREARLLGLGGPSFGQRLRARVDNALLRLSEGALERQRANTDSR